MNFHLILSQLLVLSFKLVLLLLNPKSSRLRSGILLAKKGLLFLSLLSNLTCFAFCF
ncbi:Spike glycoprotein [Bienertia sinuspersici]